MVRPSPGSPQNKGRCGKGANAVFQRLPHHSNPGRLSLWRTHLPPNITFNQATCWLRSPYFSLLHPVCLHSPCFNVAQHQTWSTTLWLWVIVKRQERMMTKVQMTHMQELCCANWWEMAKLCYYHKMWSLDHCESNAASMAGRSKCDFSGRYGIFIHFIIFFNTFKKYCSVRWVIIRKTKPNSLIYIKEKNVIKTWWIVQP